jgi:hypothetical protein
VVGGDESMAGELVPDVGRRTARPLVTSASDKLIISAKKEQT